MLGELPVQIAGLLFTTTATGVGSTITLITCGVPLAHPLSLGVMVYVAVLNAFVEFDKVPVFTEKGAVAPVVPDPATPVPVNPAGRLTATSNVKLAATLGTVVLVIEISGVPPLQMVGKLLVATAEGVGSTITFTN